MKKKIIVRSILGVLAVLCIGLGVFFYNIQSMMGGGSVELSEQHKSHIVGSNAAVQAGVPNVYMTSAITSEGLMNVYQAMGKQLNGDNTAVKL